MTSRMVRYGGSKGNEAKSRKKRETHYDWLEISRSSGDLYWRITKEYTEEKGR